MNFQLKAFKSSEDAPIYDLEDCKETTAENLNMKIVYPNANQLQLDIDSKEGYIQFNHILQSIKDSLDMEISFTQTVSKTGLPHKHVTVNLPYNLHSDFERIALQLILGSDLKREILNLLRIIDGQEAPICFFEPKEGLE